MVKTFNADTEGFIAELQEIARKYCDVRTQLEIELEVKKARKERRDKPTKVKPLNWHDLNTLRGGR